ncbi:hypothetical protein OUZ56_021783 [Daphnia magna]|uniref:Uncharacterized protein n=1 Tax=Daphnia magna TaxID=35525 RepID=A0ABR0AUF7_9CRUS|nr:hypothetical protein OUZ56_021783 [Daphnia magna]
MRDLAEELSIHAKVQTILCYVAPNKKNPTRFLESFGEHADWFLYSTKLGEQVHSTLDKASKTWIGPYSGKKPEKKNVTKKTMDSVIDENDQITTEIARNAVNIAVKKAATMKRLKLLEEQRKNKNQKLASVKPKKPMNKKSNPVQGLVNCSPPPKLIPKSSECLPSTPNNGRSSQSFTPQKICSSNLSVSLVKDRINKDPIHEQDSIFDTPVTKIRVIEGMVASPCRNSP